MPHTSSVFISQGDCCCCWCSFGLLAWPSLVLQKTKPRLHLFSAEEATITRSPVGKTETQLGRHSPAPRDRANFICHPRLLLKPPRGLVSLEVKVKVIHADFFPNGSLQCGWESPCKAESTGKQTRAAWRQQHPSALEDLRCLNIYPPVGSYKKPSSCLLPTSPQLPFFISAQACLTPSVKALL